MTRNELKADTLYKFIEDQTVFYSPDGVSGFWYDSLSDAFDELGERGFMLIPGKLED